VLERLAAGSDDERLDNFIRPGIRERYVYYYSEFELQYN
jgi:hypothetical protein